MLQRQRGLLRWEPDDTGTSLVRSGVDSSDEAEDSAWSSAGSSGESCKEFDDSEGYSDEERRNALASDKEADQNTMNAARGPQSGTVSDVKKGMSSDDAIVVWDSSDTDYDSIGHDDGATEGKDIESGDEGYSCGSVGKSVGVDAGSGKKDTTNGRNLERGSQFVRRRATASYPTQNQSRQHSMNPVRCSYAPMCRRTFQTTTEMNIHCDDDHDGSPGTFTCTKCIDRVSRFSSKKQLTRHERGSHQNMKCPKCQRFRQRENFTRHVQRCKGENTTLLPPDIDVVLDENSVSLFANDDPTSDPTSDDTSPTLPQATGRPMLETAVQPDVIGLPPPDIAGEADDTTSQNANRITRSQHLGPTEERFITLMPNYNKWLECRTAVGHRAYDEPQLKQHRNKFRTILGKLSTYFKVDLETLMVDLDDIEEWKKYFEMPKLTEFTERLSYSDRGRKLKLCTAYNYIVELDHYLYWQVKTQRCKSMRPAYKYVQGQKNQLSSDKHRERDPEEKAARIEKLPKVPEILDYLNGKLKTRMREAGKVYTATRKATWDLYVPYRDYVLVMMLFVVPPQRRQVYDQLDVNDITIEKGIYLLSLKKHKTAYKYGPVIIALPVDQAKIFEEYISIRSGIAEEYCSSLFVNEQGTREMYLTKVLKQVMKEGLHKEMTILDTRSVYITYANRMFKKDDMAALASRMYHSFDTQQRYYESTATRAKAMAFLALAKELTGNLTDPLPPVTANTLNQPRRTKTKSRKRRGQTKWRGSKRRIAKHTETE